MIHTDIYVIHQRHTQPRVGAFWVSELNQSVITQYNQLVRITTVILAPQSTH